jgi:hypothetical protein
MKLLGERVEEFRIGRRVRFPHVVFRLDNPTAEEVLPVTVHERLREERVLRVRHPVGQMRPRVFFEQGGPAAFQDQPGRASCPSDRIAGLSRALVVLMEDALVRIWFVAADDVLPPDLSKERRERP